MNTVELAKTVSKDFQSLKFGISITFPDTVKLSQATGLAGFLVRVLITKVFPHEEVVRWAPIYSECFGEPIEAFLETVCPKGMPA